MSVAVAKARRERVCVWYGSAELEENEDETKRPKDKDTRVSLGQDESVESFCGAYQVQARTVSRMSVRARQAAIHGQSCARESVYSGAGLSGLASWKSSTTSGAFLRFLAGSQV